MERNVKSATWWLRMIGIAEGISLLVLLCIAMPLKYMASIPEPVKYTGWAHGLLFVAFIMAVMYVYYQQSWPFKRVSLAFIAAFLPFGTFAYDNWLQKQLNSEAKGSN